MPDTPDLSALVDSVLSDPNALEQIKGLAQSMGLGDLLSPNGQQETAHDTPQSPPAGIPTSMLGGIGEMMPLLSKFGQEDDSTRLLHALRPFLGEERRAKLDEATKLLMVLRTINLIREERLL